MKKITYFLIIFLLGISSTAYSQFNKAGRTSFQFLKIGVGARQSALSETGIASIRDINAVFWNPALITGINNIEAAFNYTQWIGDLNVMGAAVGFKIPGVAAVAFNFISLDYGSLQEALVTGTGGSDTRTGNTFSGNDLAFGVTLARDFTDKLSIGVNIKYIQEKLFIYKTSLVAFDVGSYYDTGWRGIKLAMSAQNFSSQARWLNTREEEQQSYEIPIVYRIGWSVDLMGNENLFLGGTSDHRVSFNMDAIHSNDYAERLHMGVEYWAFDMLALRGGYRLNYDEGNLSAGVGVNYNAGYLNFRFDYSYVQYDFLDSPHRFSVLMSF